MIIYININKYIQECYCPEEQNSLKEIVSSPIKKKNNRDKIFHKENDEQIIKDLDTNLNNAFIYTITEYKKTNHEIDDDYKENILLEDTENTKIRKNQDIKEFHTNIHKEEITESKNILSTMMNTNINKKHKIDNNNKMMNNSNSSEKIQIRKDLFNINDKDSKYTNLDLEVINSWNLPKGLKLHINKDKLENSLRNAEDGKIFFGYDKDLANNKNYLSDSVKLDYLLMPKDNEYNEKFIGIHFVIKYDENNYKYYIKDLGSGYGTFIKLVSPLRIINNLLINIGDTFIVFSLNEENENISLKLFTGDEQTETYEFTPDKKIITIGRDKMSDIYIEDKLLSRKQCYIYYKNDENDKQKNKWFIKDGDIKGKKSTNDTWMYSFKDTLIYDQMIFKTNHNLFKCNCY